MAEFLLCYAEDKSGAEMMVELLCAEGIPAYYKNTAPTQVFEHITGDMHQRQSIIVNDEDAERARAFLLDLAMNKEDEIFDEFQTDRLEIQPHKNVNQEEYGKTEPSLTKKFEIAMGLIMLAIVFIAAGLPLILLLWG